MCAGAALRGIARFVAVVILLLLLLVWFLVGTSLRWRSRWRVTLLHVYMYLKWIFTLFHNSALNGSYTLRFSFNVFSQRNFFYYFCLFFVYCLFFTPTWLQTSLIFLFLLLAFALSPSLFIITSLEKVICLFYSCFLCLQLYFVATCAVLHLQIYTRMSFCTNKHVRCCCCCFFEVHWHFFVRDFHFFL